MLAFICMGNNLTVLAACILRLPSADYTCPMGYANVPYLDEDTAS